MRELVFFARVKSAFDNSARHDVANLSADESGAFPGFNVLKIDDNLNRVIKLESNALSEISREYVCHILSS